MRTTLALIILTLLPAINGLAAVDIKCVALKCEFLTDPIAADSDHPRLSWRLESKTRGQRTRAHRILVASSSKKLTANDGDLWDSGRVDTSVLLFHHYGGPKKEGNPLAAGKEVYWKVMVWDQNNQESDWSTPAKFTRALKDERDWKAEWITFNDPKALLKASKKLHLPAPRYYRKEFASAKKLKRALVQATAFGIYELHLNGKKVGDAYFAPGWTDYRKRVFYNTHDVTSLLDEGINCLGAVVADGWYAGYIGSGKRKGFGPHKSGRAFYGKTPALSVQLHLEYEDGTSEMVVSDPSWMVTTGPETEADLLMGEAYNGNRRLPGWTTAGFDASSWQPVILAPSNPRSRAPYTDGGGTKNIDFGFTKPGLMDAYPVPPVRVTQQLRARSVTKSSEGRWIFDFGQNFAGVVRLKIKGEKNQKIALRYAEVLHPDGRLMTDNLGAARATDTYICNGDSAGETWSPRFTYHGFRYAEISELREEPPLDTLTGLVLHNDLVFTSGFECSDPLVNKIYQNCIWTQRANFIDVPTNSPQGDERMGFAGPVQLSMSAGCYTMDAQSLYAKWLLDLQEARTLKGYFPSDAPHAFQRNGKPHGTAWSDAGLIGPYVLWRMYGERDVIKNRWFAIDRYMKARFKADPELVGIKFGDFHGDERHLNDPTPLEFLDLCYLALDVRLMMEMARVNGGPIVYTSYRNVLLKVLKSFQTKYLNANGSLKIKSQTAHVLALRFGIVPNEHRSQIVSDLLVLIKRAQKGGKQSGMTTGLLGTKALLTVLAQNGQIDEAVRLIQSRKYPSWGYEIENGATTIWEHWDAFSKENNFRHGSSFSHLGNSAVSEWIMSSLAGISASTPGFDYVTLQPGVQSTKAQGEIQPVTWVRAHYDSVRGRISMHWKRNADGSFFCEATIPPSIQALLKLPTPKGAMILESGTPLADALPQHIGTIKSSDEKQTWVTLASGSYKFEVK